MTTPDTQATLEALARETVECPQKHARRTEPLCTVCHGTGLVLRYKELTEECPGYLYLGTDPPEVYHPKDCNCSGTGRVPLQGPALLVAVDEAIGPHTHHFDGQYHGYVVGATGEIEVWGLTDRLAAAVKALAALAQRGKDG